MTFFDAEEHTHEICQREETEKLFFNRSQDDGDDEDENDEEQRHMAVVQQTRSESVSSSEMMVGITTSPASTTTSPFTSISTSDEVWPETSEDPASKTCSNPLCSCTSCTCGSGCQCGRGNQKPEQMKEQIGKPPQSTRPGSAASSIPAQTLPAPQHQLLPVKPIKPPRPRPAPSSSMQPPTRSASRQHIDDNSTTYKGVVVPNQAELGGDTSPPKPRRLAINSVARPFAPNHARYILKEGEFKDPSDMEVGEQPEEQEPDPVQPLINRLHDQLRTTSRSLPPLALNVAKQQEKAVISTANLLVEDPLLLLPVINSLHARIRHLETKVFGAKDQQKRKGEDQSLEPSSPGIHIASA